MAKKEHVFTTFLRNEFEGRKSRNKAYSLRAFANFLEVNPAVVSKIFSGKSDPTAKYIEAFGLKLGMPLKEIQKLCRAEEINNIIQEDKKFKKYKQITLDSYEIIAEWYHIALLYLRDNNKILYPAEELAKKLGVPKAKIDQALKRLERLEVIGETPKGYKVLTDAFYTNVEDTHAEEAARKFVKEILNKSMDALELTPKTERVHSTLTMSFPKKNLENARKFIHNFRKKFLSTFDEYGKDNDVYTMQISFFPLSKDE